MIAKLKCPLTNKVVKVWEECSQKDCKYLIAGIHHIDYYRIGDTKKKRYIKSEITPILYYCEKVGLKKLGKGEPK